MMPKLKDFGWFLLKTAAAMLVINTLTGMVPALGNFYRNPIGYLKSLTGGK